MVTQIFLIRHGETAWSLTGQHTGHTDLPLTKNGERRAARLRGLLQGIQFTHVLTSPLQRARRTCELAGFGAVARIEPDLHELDYGDYEGRTTDDIRLQHPGWSMFQDGSPHGESVQQFSKRADRVISALHSLDGIVAIFSHGQFLRALAARWIGLPVQEGQHFALDTASISILGLEHTGDEIPAITLWNTTSSAALEVTPNCAFVQPAN
jgi:probable phosphoglycerate mutase